MTDELRKFFVFQCEPFERSWENKQDHYKRGAYDNHVRTLEVIEAMIECVEALEKYKLHEVKLIMSAKGSMMYDTPTPAKDALANLRAKLEAGK